MCGALSAFGEQITKVGVVDLTKIFNAFYKDSKTIKDLYDYWNETEAQLGKISKDISDLDEKREKAKQDGKDKDVLAYDKAISDKQEYQREYYRYRKLEYDKKFDTITKSSDLYNEILRVIEYIAVRDSYSLILKNNDPSIIYYSKDIDITEDVLEYLKR
jgi:outer membrane protein